MAGRPPAADKIDHVAETLKKLTKDKNYKKDAELAISQWNNTLEEMKTLKLKEEKKSSERNAEREREKDMRIFSLDQQLKELTLRLSTIAGNQMSDAHSDITDLSDPYRPTKLAEMFKEVYNEEWTESFQHYDTLFKDEDKVLEKLAFFPQDIYTFCRHLFNQQTELVEAHVQHMLSIMKNPKFRVNDKNYVSANNDSSTREESKETEQEARLLVKKVQKSMAKSSTSALFKLYLDVSSFNGKPEWIKDVASSETLKKFISKLLGIIWLMMSHDPPIVLKWLAPGSNIDKTSFAFYTRSSDIVQRTVWPAVCLSETGPLMAKGVVQTK